MTLQKLKLLEAQSEQLGTDSKLINRKQLEIFNFGRSGKTVQVCFQFLTLFRNSETLYKKPTTAFKTSKQIGEGSKILFNRKDFKDCGVVYTDNSGSIPL